MNQLLPETESAPALLAMYRPIADDLQTVECIFRDTLASKRPGVADLLEHLENYRGKRLRPSLLLLTARACGDITHAHHVLGAVVEMIHTATLVHDDVLDSATTRRHVSTVNALWGNQSSILLGDYLFTHAFHLTSTIGDAQACEIIGEATNRVCEGELHQIVRRGCFELSEQEYFDIIDGKTAELTACCSKLGALYADASPTVVAAMERYGRYLGIAFQIADDVLDLVGDEHNTGKSLGTDVEQKKLTLPLIHLLHHVSAQQSEDICHALHNGQPNKRAFLQPYLADAGSMQYARTQAESYAERAAAELTYLPASECREILHALTEKVVHRDR